MAEEEKSGPPPRGRRRRGRGRSRASVSNRPVPLHKRSASHFQRGDRQRGQEYFQEDRVRLSVDGSRARARVEGTERQAYSVGLDWSAVGDRVLHAFCECPRFADRRPCKHVWATLLALENVLESQPPGRDRVSLRKDRAAAWRDLGISADRPRAPARPGRRAHHARPPRQRRRATSGAGLWRSQLAAIGESSGRFARQRERAKPPAADVLLLVNTSASLGTSGLILDVFGRKHGRGKQAGKLKRASIDPERLEGLLQPASPPERRSPAGRSPETGLEAMGLLESGPVEAGAGALAPEAPDPGEPAAAVDREEPLSIVTALPVTPPGPKGRSRRKPQKAQAAQVQRLRLPKGLFGRLLPDLCNRRLLGWWDGRRIGDPRPLYWDSGEPWRLALRLEHYTAGSTRLTGGLERNGQVVALSEPKLILGGNTGPDHGGGGLPLVLFGDSLARLEAGSERYLPWITLLRGAGEVIIPKEDLEEALTTLLELPDLPRIEAPSDLQLTEETSPLHPRLFLEADSAPEWMDPPLLAELSFDYGEVRVSASDPRAAIVDWQAQKYLRRDMDEEHTALVRLLELGVHPVESAAGHELEISPRELPAVAEPLLTEGWTVEAHGHPVRPPSPPALRVESGIDWFELSGSMDFDGDPVELKAVLEAISKGDRFIELGDGSKGLLPSTWMETYDSLAQLAHDSSDDGLRFLPSQALLVDALLTAMPPANVDRAFAELRQKLQTFDRIKPKRELKSFGGTLREYQRHGLGWLSFLREFGLGGVLADDMGLGKTVQVLALLQAYRTKAKSTGLPSLVVAPRSLVYNWIDEAARFTPKLKFVEYAGPSREALRERLSEFDVLVTTYGTMRLDIGFLATVEFDTVILDEAQAIKNPASQTAKAAGLLGARNRLALTGTPIENHLGELGSIFEFLNPGLLGRLPKLEVMTSGRHASGNELKLVAQGVRPFILRRTKAQVLPDLPDKTEQVLFCSLRPPQQEIYDKVRASYQASLLEQVEAKGVGGSAIQVLEALLRLRQVACHPGLVDPEWEEAGSAKLEALFEQVDEILDEGHKVLMFSQFTKLLAYVRRELDQRSQTYAYLDGQTRKRAEVVERFQTDPECNLFLISLKAGGTGLNLTAAGYVFLLDPWWNPAVEAQAIDRAHRIGQNKPVFAYRMIARDTVEEKILELQRSKRQIASAILDQDAGEGQSLRDLTAEDLRMLLS